ncbi:ATP-binding protein [Thermopolyspora sp. NPDC052614]|uniref:sensor histidine kinase n=1 Tax=Thermopolyspora sp. NPDC052614 TaxID=3155682 RepID=UPI00342DAA61
MSADASHRTQRRLAARERAVLATLGMLLVVSCAWLWATLASPAEVRGMMALVGGVSALLLTAAVVIVQHYAATTRVALERARRAVARTDLMEREAMRIADETVPTLGRQVRAGIPVADALPHLPYPSEGPFQHLLKVLGHELDVLERERAAARAARVAMEDEVARIAEETLPDLVRRVHTQRMPVDAALAEVRRPVFAPLRTLLGEVGRQLGEGERRGAAAMAACAGAAARVQAQATSLLARLRELEDVYGDREDVFADLLDLDHRVSQMSRLADNIALLSGGRSGRRWTRPIVMESILRGAMGRIAAYRRIRLHNASTVAVAGYAAEGVMHALAELMDNATTFSAHGNEVHVYVDEEDAGVVVTIEDSGLGMRPRERDHAARLVSEPLDLRTLSGTRLGLAVVGRLADKYGLTVSFRPSARGGTGVVLLIPRLLITQPRPAEPSPLESAQRSALPAVPNPAVSPEDAPAAQTAAARDRGAEAAEDEGSLPRRRRGQTLAEANRTRKPQPAKPARSAAEAAARLAAFRDAGGRGRTPGPSRAAQPSSDSPASALASVPASAPAPASAPVSVPTSEPEPAPTSAPAPAPASVSDGS